MPDTSAPSTTTANAAHAPHTSRGSEAVADNVVERVAAILGGLAEMAVDVGPTALGRALRMHPATTHRLLRSLAKTGLVQYFPDRRTYGLGERVLELGLAVQAYLPVRPAMLDTLERLRDITGESAVLFSRSSSVHVTALDAAVTEKLPRREFVGGARLLLHQLPAGMLILAQEPDAFIERYVAAVPLVPAPRARTESGPPMEPARVMADARALRGQRYSWTPNTMYAANAMHFVLLNGAGVGIGSVTVHGPAERWTREAMEASVAECLAALDAVAPTLRGIDYPFQHSRLAPR